MNFSWRKKSEEYQGHFDGIASSKQDRSVTSGMSQPLIYNER